MKFLFALPFAILTLCTFATPDLSLAQPGVDGPPPVLVVNREFLKPGRSGTAHEKTEAAYLAAARAGKAPIRYFALASMTGLDRALFLSPYASFAAWEADHMLMDRTPATGAGLDHAMLADGDLLSSTDVSVWLHRPELSLHESNLVGYRYFEIQQVILKPGHMKAAEEWIKMYVDGYKKIPSANWATYQQAYGTNSNALVFLTLVKTLASSDAEFGSSDAAFRSAMGESAMKKLAALEAEVVESEMTNLFRISPKMSLPSEEMIKGEPDFWKPKTAPASKKPAPPPAE